MSKTIVFTGGGTAGHVLPNFPLIERFLEDRWRVVYIGSKDGIEKELIVTNFPEIEYYGITCDKLRRYFTYKHFFMPFKLFYGLFETFFLLKKIKPKIVFSKGGFVSIPTTLTAFLLRIPVIAHESDYSIGLANKLIFSVASLVCVSFDKSIYDAKYHHKMIQVGPLIRKSFLEVKKSENFHINFSDSTKKTILILGGSLGSKIINEFIHLNLKELTEKFNIIHICGNGNMKIDLEENTSYVQFEYINDGLQYLMSISDIIISRAGINSLFEILFMKKPHILIPLSKKCSRGDQIENAQYFEKLGVSFIIQEENLDLENVMSVLSDIFENYDLYVDKIKKLNLIPGQEFLYQEISRFYLIS